MKETFRPKNLTVFAKWKMSDIRIGYMVSVHDGKENHRCRITAIDDKRELVKGTVEFYGIGINNIKWQKGDSLIFHINKIFKNEQYNF